MRQSSYCEKEAATHLFNTCHVVPSKQAHPTQSLFPDTTRELVIQVLLECMRAGHLGVWGQRLLFPELQQMAEQNPGGFTLIR